MSEPAVGRVTQLGQAVRAGGHVGGNQRAPGPGRRGGDHETVAGPRGQRLPGDLLDGGQGWGSGCDQTAEVLDGRSRPLHLGEHPRGVVADLTRQSHWWPACRRTAGIRRPAPPHPHRPPHGPVRPRRSAAVRSNLRDITADRGSCQSMTRLLPESAIASSSPYRSSVAGAAETPSMATVSRSSQEAGSNRAPGCWRCRRRSPGSAWRPDRAALRLGHRDPQRPPAARTHRPLAATSPRPDRVPGGDGGSSGRRVAQPAAGGTPSGCGRLSPVMAPQIVEPVPWWDIPSPCHLVEHHDVVRVLVLQQPPAGPISTQIMHCCLLRELAGPGRATNCMITAGWDQPSGRGVLTGSRSRSIGRAPARSPAGRRSTRSA
jgi:hypothetical protein